MSERDAQIMEQGTRVQTSRSNSAEWKMINMLDRKKELERYKEEFEKLAKGTLKTPGFMQQIAPVMVEQILFTIHTTKDERLRVSASQDLLDRAGYGKISKSVVAHQDLGFQETKRELINSVVSLARKAGINVKEENHVEGDEDVVTVEVADSEPARVPNFMDPNRTTSSSDSE